jgi:catechol 2,3-dioxygenase-like lactoylglutathione lyase family enzyme
MPLANPALETLGLPPIDQVGFVVRDLDAAIARYAPLFGPFNRIDGSVRACEFRGRIADVELDIAFASGAGVEIELIQWRGGESPHAEFTQQGREGMHHLRFRVDDVDAWIAKVQPLGYRPIWYKRFSPEITFAYLERSGDPLLIEFVRLP